MRAVELIAYWEGRLITNQLTEYFGITRQQASADINRYNQEINEGALIRDAAQKGYVPAADFKPVLTNGHIDEYLDMISGVLSQSASPLLFTDDNIASVRLPERAVMPEVVRVIIRACRQKHSLSIHYASMKNPDGGERIISPHTLVYSGFRWHVRAYCHKRKEFRDFLLSRITEIPEPSPEKAVDISNDKHWNSTCVLKLTANPLLNDQQKKLIAKDYAMTQGKLKLEVKQSLAHYTLQRYQVGITEEELKDPQKFPLVLENKKDIEQLMFGAEM